MHGLGLILIRHKSDDTAVIPGIHCQARLLANLPDSTFLRTFSFFKLAANADPFIMIDIVFLFDAVEHEIVAVLLQIA